MVSPFKSADPVIQNLRRIRIGSLISNLTPLFVYSGAHKKVYEYVL